MEKEHKQLYFVKTTFETPSVLAQLGTYHVEKQILLNPKSSNFDTQMGPQILECSISGICTLETFPSKDLTILYSINLTMLYLLNMDTKIRLKCQQQQKIIYKKFAEHFHTWKNRLLWPIINYQIL